MHSRSLPPAQTAPPADTGHAALESLLVPALVRQGDSPREAKQNATRTRRSSAPLPPLAPAMRVGDDVEVAGSENSSKVHSSRTPLNLNPNPLNPNPNPNPTSTLTPTPT